MGRLRTTFIVLLLLAMTASADSADLGILEADAVTGAGHAHMQADLVGYWTGRSSMPNDQAIAWTLEAATVEVTQETIEGSVYALSTGTRTDPDSGHQSETRQNASIRVISSQVGTYTFVANDDAHIDVRGTNVNAAPTRDGELSEPGKDVDQQPPLAASWTDAISISSPEAIVHIEGDFIVGLWGAVIEVQNDEGEEQWISGIHNKQSADREGNVAVADESWLYLRVSNGRLAFPSREVLPATLLGAGDASSFSVAGSLQLQSADGMVLGQAVDNEHVSVFGDLSAPDIRAVDGRLAFALKGDADSYVLDGRLVAVSPAKEGLSWLWSFAAVPVIAAWLVRRQQPARRVARLRDALGRGRFSGVVRRAPRFFGTPWDKEARIATAVAYLRLDAPDRAMDVLEEGDVPRGMTCFLRAHALAIMGQLLEARALLREALESAPHLRYEAERNPALAPLLSVGSTEAYA